MDDFKIVDGVCVIPEGIKNIEDCAFWGCSGLTSVIIPDSVKEIGFSAFYGCSGLTSIVIPDGVKNVRDDTFSGCSGLTSAVIPNSVENIGDRAFWGCSGLTSIVIPNNVTKINDSTFYNCKRLTSVIIPDSVTKIGYGAFKNCFGLTSIVIPNSVTEIDESAFHNCKRLTSVVIPDSVSKIGDSAFMNCLNLQNIEIPKNVYKIATEAFDWNLLKINGVDINLTTDTKKSTSLKDQLLSSVSSWNNFASSLKYDFLVRYYPISCGFQATQSEWNNRRLVWNFKNDPKKTSEIDHELSLKIITPAIVKKLADTFGDNLHKLTFVCIPASSQINNSRRYEKFSNLVCSQTGMTNAYYHIQVNGERIAKHSGEGKDKDFSIHIDSDFFRDKYVILFDDIITTGSSLIKYKTILEKLGAYVIAGLTIGKTFHERPSDYEE